MKTGTSIQTFCEGKQHVVPLFRYRYHQIQFPQKTFVANVLLNNTLRTIQNNHQLLDLIVLIEKLNSKLKRRISSSMLKILDQAITIQTILLENHQVHVTH